MKLFFLSLLLLYKIRLKAALREGSQVWILNERFEYKLEATLMRSLRRLSDLTRLHKQNYRLPQKLEAICIVADTRLYQQNWRKCGKNGTSSPPTIGVPVSWERTA